MFFWFTKSRGLAVMVLTLMALPTSQVFAQDRNEEALIMVSSAMDAYSNLEMERAKELLEGALAFGEELENDTLSKIYSNLGVLFISGFSDNPAGQIHFIKSVCLDEEANVDPLFSTPEIDLVFTQSKEAAIPEKCEELGIIVPGAAPAIDPCGIFEPLEEQKKSYELPFFVEIAPAVKYQLDRMVLHYSYDSGKYQELEFSPKSSLGFGALVECETQDLRTNNPDEVVYYIEGLASDGSTICGHGTDEYPLTVSMSEFASPLPAAGGMVPKECLQCDPTDDACNKRLAALTRGDAKTGETCTSDNACIEGLICDPEMFVCGIKKAKKKERKGTGPQTFYVNLTAGAGFGYLKKEVKITKTAFPRHREITFTAGGGLYAILYRPIPYTAKNRCDEGPLGQITVTQPRIDKPGHLILLLHHGVLYSGRIGIFHGNGNSAHFRFISVGVSLVVESDVALAFRGIFFHH